MKKFILATMFAAAAIFTACGDDDSTSSSSGPVASCDITASFVNDPVHACIETDDMQDAEKECKEEIKGNLPSLLKNTEVAFGSGCASGSKSKCKYDMDGAHITVYLYDATLSAMSCDQLKMFIMQ